ncbi:PEP-CTERM sorting domain-containing protein [Amantichitinum ursilacus]|uniref:Ice-binding protein C-terminal domain-containing protein n=1 Tax=Amantichitinum ursilacus TaxID=857265 RepID=A0A0N0XLG2_9NEIS|nr:PEP-CTERM sorting domain-containing protein [Amantichitinum ursilacus]KPC55453.1 hypothetical protein WG78_02310 [Amantichitinum ursilacus]
MKPTLIAIALAVSGSAHADILTFDNYDGSGTYPIYNTLTISGLGVLNSGDGGTTPLPNGTTKALVGAAPDYPATYSGSISSQFGFIFNGAYIAGYFSDGYPLNADWVGITGYYNGQYVGQVSINPYEDFKWTGGISGVVNQLVFDATPSRQIARGWVLDAIDYQLTPVPEPETWVLALVGLVGIASRSRAKARRQGVVV